MAVRTSRHLARKASFTVQRLSWGVLLGLYTFAGSALAQQTNDSKNLQIPRLAGTVQMDGKLDDAVWSQAALIEDFAQTFPVEFATPTQRTTPHPHSKRRATTPSSYDGRRSQASRKTKTNPVK